MGAIQSSINSVIGSMAMARVLGNAAKPSLPKAKVQPIAPTSETQQAAEKEVAKQQIALNPNLTFAQIFEQNPTGLLDLQQPIQGEGMKQAVDRQKENWNQRKKILKARKRK